MHEKCTQKPSRVPGVRQAACARPLTRRAAASQLRHGRRRAVPPPGGSAGRSAQTAAPVASEIRPVPGERGGPARRVQQQRERDRRDEIAGHAEHRGDRDGQREPPRREVLGREPDHADECQRVTAAQHSPGQQGARIGPDDRERQLRERHDAGRGDQQPPRAVAVHQQAGGHLHGGVHPQLGQDEHAELAGRDPEPAGRLERGHAERGAAEDRRDVHGDCDGPPPERGRGGGREGRGGGRDGGRRQGRAGHGNQVPGGTGLVRDGAGQGGAGQGRRARVLSAWSRWAPTAFTAASERPASSASRMRSCSSRVEPHPLRVDLGAGGVEEVHGAHPQLPFAQRAVQRGDDAVAGGRDDREMEVAVGLHVRGDIMCPHGGPHGLKVAVQRRAQIRGRQAGEDFPGRERLD